MGMRLTDEEKELIAVRAQTLHERLATPSVGATGTVDDPGDWMDEWRERVSDGDLETFSKRLELSDLSVEACRRRIGTQGWPETKLLPDWVDRIDDLLAYVEAVRPAESRIGVMGEDEVPFAHVLSVVVAYASEQVDWSNIPKQVTAEFDRWLLERLRTLFSHPLFIEFKTFIASRDPDLASADDPEMPTAPRLHYDSFTENLLDGDLKSFFLEYAVLAKLLARFVRQWTVAAEEFCAHLTADRTAIEETFCPDADLGPVTDIDYLGDSHHDGKVVLGVTFESGVKVAYKPRNIETDVRFYDLLSWINERTTLPNVRTLDCLTRADYGWVEWVRSEDCSSTAGVARYYRRAGMLLSLLYALNFTDGHLENVVAAGEQPVVVDLETLMEPTLAAEKRPMRNEMYQLVHDSVLQTHILPMHLPRSDVQDIGGLGSTAGRATGVEMPTFEDVNTDVMELEYEDTRTIEGNSLPRVDGERMKPTAFHESFVDGFEDMYRFLLDHRAELLREDGPIEAFRNAECRFLYRSTNTYGRILVPLTTPAYLRTGLKFGCKVEMLAKAFAEGKLDPELWDIYRAERKAMWRFDVPRFSVRTTDTALVHDGRSIGNPFDTTPLEQVRQRIESLDLADLREQLDYLRLAYAPEELSHPTPPGSRPAGTPATEPLVELSEHQPREIFARIRENAVRTPSDDIAWHIREHRNDGIYFHRILNDLYEGRIGVALFGGALATVFEENAYRDFTADVVSPLMDKLSDADPFEDERIGVGHGLGSLVYGFTKLGELLADDQYTGAARRIAALLTTERIEQDTTFDAIGGSAGAILGLLALYDATGDTDALARAVTAGDHLLSNRIEADGVRVWHTINDVQVLTGFTHGVAGIAYALFKLADATGQSRFREAALESIEYERERYAPDRNNWPDLRLLTDTDFVTGWCSGRAGVGLARLGIYELTGEREFQREVDQALLGTDPEMLVDRDHICCGNFGRVTFLQRAGRVFDNADYRDQARELASAVVQRAEASGRYSVPWQTNDWYNPAFFMGESGIGYTLLRLANPELPCVLLWE